MSFAGRAFLGAVLVTSAAHALDLPKLWGKPLSLDVTEVTIVGQRFDSREVTPITEGGAWGQWINRIQTKLDWNHFTVGIRLDSAAYWNTLSEQCNNPNHQAVSTFGTVPSAAGDQLCSSSPNQRVLPTIYPAYMSDDLTRFQNSIYVAKMWATYTNRKAGLEVTVGDSYVQFARGLVLSMRKVDDLGIDSTVRGIKVTEAKGPFSVTVLAGLANPSRVDEATGQALFTSKRVTDPKSPVYSVRLEQPSFGADQIYGAELVIGRQGPLVATTSLSLVNRCSPNAYTSLGRVTNPNTFNDLVGYCDDSNRDTWLGGLPANSSTRGASDVLTVAQSFELPKLGKWGNVYVVGALQNRDGQFDAQGTSTHQGLAFYATYVAPLGKRVTTTLEYKQYDNFYPTGSAVNASQLAAFSTLAWSAVPTMESIVEDNLFGNFNVCVVGGRARTDWRVAKRILVFAQGMWQVSRGEQNAVCDAAGNITGVPDSAKAALTDYVSDGVIGTQLRFERRQTIMAATLGTRQDWLGTGTQFVRQYELTYTFNQKLSKNVAIEILGRHRVRYELSQNVGMDGLSHEWVEGENYLGLSIAPRWVITQGFEYSTLDLPASTKFAFIDNYPAWLYLSAGGIYKLTKSSNIKVFLGQQRGGLKCISGVCRVFPAFEGARAELTLRF